MKVLLVDDLILKLILRRIGASNRNVGKMSFKIKLSTRRTFIVSCRRVFITFFIIQCIIQGDSDAALHKDMADQHDIVATDVTVRYYNIFLTILLTLAVLLFHMCDTPVLTTTCTTVVIPKPAVLKYKYFQLTEWI